MKALLAGSGLPVGRYAVVTPRQWAGDRAAVRETVATLGYPVFVKPCRAGSSVGITKVREPEELDDAIEVARSHDPRVIVEAMVEGREIECGVLEGRDGGPPEASVPAEVIVGAGHDFYDFDAKYLSCEGLARVDFFLDRHGAVLVNEVNTMPGFTPSSMFPLMWRATGLDYPELVDRLVQSALARPTGLR
jgi:D-alanine-D-alanine ligase